MMRPIVIIPGLGNSGPLHWQRLWQAELGNNARMVEQDDWDRPNIADWVARLDRVIADLPVPPVLVAHSLSCALVAHWVAKAARAVAGALLVAPADVDSDTHTPPETRSFRPMPMSRLPFPSTVVASGDDPYVARARAQAFALAWGSRFVDIGAAGHINTASGFGEWPLGRLLLGELAR
ncbi:RBBP9/YdeN family alpha/beta hydrolase [Dongia sp.]|uniref:RBBP9/YdeN family alpha/beta hydrolase n=1 Tax=Dongia sp. TaxID=1977262 RepID=UPI0035B499B3